MKTVLVALTFAYVALAAPTSRCHTALVGELGLSSNYDETVAHAIHSITLNELQKFEPTATEANRIPTVNRAIAEQPKQRVLPSAPKVTRIRIRTRH